MVKVEAAEHEVVRPGQELIAIVDDSVLRAQFLVPSTHLAQLTVGRSVRIALHETGQTVAGTISHVGAVIDPASSTVKVYAEVKNPDGQLRGGMRGTLSLDEPES